MPNTVRLRGCGRYDEAEAAGTIIPGHLVTFNTAKKLVVHGTADGGGVLGVAYEDDLQGKDIDAPYASGDMARFFIPRPGDEFYLWLKDGENVVIGDILDSGGNGTVIKYVAPATASAHPQQQFMALEALNLVGGATADGRIRARKL